VHGPLFAHVVLADEINRTPPKTQSALLEAMQEGQVTVSGKRHKLPSPFFVLATQNPIEQEGTYPLPEAQQDRFMFNLMVGYPDEEEEFRIIESTTLRVRQPIERIINAEELQVLQSVVRRVPVAAHVIRYAMRLTRATRKEYEGVPAFIREYVTWGAGPRAGQCLIWAAQARAVLHGRCYVSIEDVRALAVSVMRHRIITNFNAEADGVTPTEIVRRLLEQIPRETVSR